MMPFCPKCRSEYREGFTECYSCQEPLAAELDPLPEPSAEVPYIEDEPAFLVSVPSSVEADIIVSLLESADIPVMKRYKGAGAYLTVYMGTPNVTADIFVPSKLLSNAQELINSANIIDDGWGAMLPSEEQEFKEHEAKIKKRQRFLSRIWLVPLLPYVIAGALFILLWVFAFVVYSLSKILG